MRVEIVSIGRELVTGRTRDRNSPFMAGRLFDAGIGVSRITLVDDSVREIASTIQGAIDRKSDVIITSGGLGPTPDDVTLEGLARVAGVTLFPDPKAVKMVGERYKKFFEEGLVPSPEMSRERLKMATIPDGSRLIENRVGAAPGIIISISESKIYSLPGVPAEIESIFVEVVQPELVRLFGGGAVVVRKVTSHFGDESLIARIVKEVNERYPSIYIKPKPFGFGKDLRLKVEFLSDEYEREGESQIDEAVSYFMEMEKKIINRENEK